MIPINSIIVSSDYLSFNATMELYFIFDNFIPIFTESLSEKVINAIIDWVRYNSSEIHDISEKTLISLFEDYKYYRIKRFKVDIYMNLFKEDNEPIENILDSLIIKDLKIRAYIHDYIRTKYYT